MSVAKVFGGQAEVSGATIVEVETDIGKGLFSFSIVGLPDKAIDEAKDRVNSSIKNSGFKPPKSGTRKIVISLAPADVKKEGPAFDLPIAISYLLSAEEIKFNPKEKIFLGELSLDGKIRKVKGVLPIAIEARKKGFKEMYVPSENAKEASMVRGIKIFKVESLGDLLSFLNEKNKGKRFSIAPEEPINLDEGILNDEDVDLAFIQGQKMAKRALEIAASGGHNLLLYGPPGTGKTMLAKAFQSILPPLEFEEALESTSIHSIAGILGENPITKAPFRSPHHTSSYASVIGGGGTNLRPGEVTLAHRGVLFLDEFPEFDRRVIESLREPLEEGHITIARAKGTVRFPSKFSLIAAMNPCPCGNFGSEKHCVCPPIAIQRYQRKISGPIMDRIDMWVEVSNIDHNLLSKAKTGETSKEVRKRVIEARNKQHRRFKELGIKKDKNSELGAKQIIEGTLPSKEALKILEDASKKLGLSPRSFHRMLKLSRTIADLDQSEEVKPSHVLEAVQFRQKREFV